VAGSGGWNGFSAESVPGGTTLYGLTLEKLATSSLLQTTFGGPGRSGALRAIAIGDSTTMGDSVHPNWYVYNTGPDPAQLPDGSWPAVGPFEYRHGPRSWFEHACWQSMGRLRPIFNAGQGSDTSNGMVRRFASDVLAKKPDILFLGDAHNDGAMSEAQSRKNTLWMIDQAQSAGIRVVLTTPYPEDDLPTSVRMRRHGAWLKKVAQERGLLLSDKYAAVVDPADGTWLAANQVDGTHSSYAGAQAAGARVLADISGILGGGPDWLPSANIADTNLLSNALFVNNITGASGSWAPSSSRRWSPRVRSGRPSASRSRSSSRSARSTGPAP
jgi:hypothetical protein